MAESKVNQNISTGNMQPKPALSLHVDLIRSVGLFLVILLHVSIQYVTVPSELQVNAWWAYDFYNSIARPCVPLFVMLSGYLMLQPSKVNEPLKVFFKKRWARIGLPFIFWGAIYVVWVGFFDNGSFAPGSIVQSILQGPYVTFWFLYMLVGLYLLTPILRVFVAHAREDVMKLLLITWFIGTGLLPFAGLFGFYLNNNVFVLPGWIGYFLLGAYLPKLKVRQRPLRLYALLVGGFAWTMIASAFMEINPGAQLYFFYDYLTANVIVASVSMFLLLGSVSTKSLQKMPSGVNKLLHTASENTLPIYLFHMLLVEAFQKGLFGFTLNIMTTNPIIMTPLLAAIVFLLSLGVIVPLKRVPYIKQLIG